MGLPGESTAGVSREGGVKGEKGIASEVNEKESLMEAIKMLGSWPKLVPCL